MRFINNIADNGGAVYIEGPTSNVSFTDCQFIGNIASNGSSLYLYMGSVSFEQCLFSRGGLNSGQGTVAYAYYGTSIDFVSCTIAGNLEPDSPLMFLFNSPTRISNSIIAENSCSAPVESMIMGVTELNYTTIYGNSGGNWVGPLEEFDGVNGNVEEDPAFLNSDDGDFHLAENSPCIDTGNPNLPNDPDDTVADKGAFYYDQSFNGVEEQPLLPADLTLSPAWPNPFNARTTVELTLARSHYVEVELVDVLGRQVKTLLTGVQPAGVHRVEVNASGLAAGVYLLRAQIEGQRSQVQKLVLLK